MAPTLTLIETPSVVTNEFTLTDFRLAGFLIVRGAAFLGVIKNPDDEVVFRFGPEPDPQALLCQYPSSPEASYDAACRNMHEFVKMALRSNFPSKRRGKNGS
jgi:hypothetical protein